MSKERLTTFIDAVLAIVMTILVLDLKLPVQITVGGFWALRDQFIAYFISFFWIGTTWVGLHNNWHRVKTITRGAPWLAIGLLFFSSLVPYATRIVSAHVMSVGGKFSTASSSSG